MQPVVPQLQAPTSRVAEDQPQYEPITVALVTHAEYWVRPKASYNTVVMAFRPSDAERAAIAAGADIYVGLLTFAYPQQPIIVLAGKEEASAVYNVPVLPEDPTKGRNEVATKQNAPAVQGESVEVKP